MVRGEPAEDGRTASSNLNSMNMAHLVRSTAAVVVGRAQLARRRLRRGGSASSLDGDVAQIEAAMRRLIDAVEQRERRRGAERALS